MLKGATIKDGDAGWEGVKLRDGATLLMMGSKEEDIPTRPQEKTKFVEDMDESELHSALDMPAGLQGPNSMLEFWLVKWLEKRDSLFNSETNLTNPILSISIVFRISSQNLSDCSSQNSIQHFSIELDPRTWATPAT